MTVHPGVSESEVRTKCYRTNVVTDLLQLSGSKTVGSDRPSEAPESEGRVVTGRGRY